MSTRHVGKAYSLQRALGLVETLCIHGANVKSLSALVRLLSKDEGVIKLFFLFSVLLPLSQVLSYCGHCLSVPLIGRRPAPELTCMTKPIHLNLYTVYTIAL